MRADDLRGRAPDVLVDLWAGAVPELTAIQESAVRAGILETGRNYLVMAPTSSGKTLVGEMAAVTAAYTRRGSAVFLVPFRALADEHFHRFAERYRGLLSVVISTSDWSEYDDDINHGNFGLAVMTYEKLAALFVQSPGLIQRLSSVVVDEVQMISETERGARLELLLTSLLASTTEPQIVALSASLDDLNGLDAWLRAELVASSERPVPLHESVVGPGGEALLLDAGEVHRQTITSQRSDLEALLAGLVDGHVRDGRQVLVFRTTIKRTQDTAASLAMLLPAPGVSSGVGTALNQLDESDVTNTLRRTLASGVGFHNADMTTEERRLVEDAFRAGDARVLVSTTTLAMGVNLPTDIVIVADSRRFMPHPQRGWAITDISVSEYRNSAGRAGRLGLRTAGTSILLAESDEERRQLFDFYLLGDVEPVESQIPRRPFTDLVFEVVTGRNGCTLEQIVELVSRTYAFTTFYERLGSGLAEVSKAVSAAVSSCLAAGLLYSDGDGLYATPVGLAMARHGVSYDSAIRLATLVQAEAQTPHTRAEIYYLAATNQESGSNPYLPRRFGQAVDPRPVSAAAQFDTSRQESALRRALDGERIDETQGHSLIKLSCIVEFASGMPYPAISRRYTGAAPSRVAALGRNVAWQIDAIAEAGGAVGLAPDRAAEIRRFASEARYGVPAEAVGLARLRIPGIQREALARLVPLGLADTDAALDAPAEAFSDVLTAVQVARLKAAILRDAEDSLSRRRAGQLARLERTSIPARILDALYAALGTSFEQAVAEALTHVGISAQRILRQPHGEEDIQIVHPRGLVVVSVTASEVVAKKVRWSKAREVLAAGAGQNPINCVCVARPDFDDLAYRRATEIATESGQRSILLVPLFTFAEAFVRILEGRLRPEQFLGLLGDSAGVLADGDLEALAGDAT